MYGYTVFFFKFHKNKLKIEFIDDYIIVWLIPIPNIFIKILSDWNYKNIKVIVVIIVIA